jgi:hypothetical protein
MDLPVAPQRGPWGVCPLDRIRGISLSAVCSLRASCFGCGIVRVGMSSAGTHDRRGQAGVKHPMLLALSMMASPVLWIVLVSSTKLHELLLGAFACAITVVFTVFVCRHSRTQLTLRPGDIAQCWRIPWYMVSGVSEILLLLLKDLLHLAPAEDLFRVSGFDSSLHDPVRVARSIMAVGYTTMAPNFIVVDIDPSQSRMLFHQIGRSSMPKMTQALGARG